MKFYKPYKLCFAVAVAAIVGLSVSEGVYAADENVGAYTIRDMMNRRSKGIKPALKKSSVRDSMFARNYKQPEPEKRKVEKNKGIKYDKIDLSACEANNCGNFVMPVDVTEENKALSGDIPLAVPVSRTPAVTPVAAPVVPAAKSAKKPLFASGPIFDTGSCSVNHSSGPIFDTGPCEQCASGPLINTGPCETCEPPRLRIANHKIEYNDFIYQAVARNCCDMAPIYLEHVDFNLSKKSDYMPYGNKMGNYRFRIFGCRRYDKEAILNKGRILEKNMNFNKIFEEVTGDCYNLVKMPQDLCLETTPSPLPEYILTAEITDFFMNVCDGYNWKDAQKAEKRTGSAEITVRWKLTNITKTKVVWEGETTGYSDLTVGEDNGEITLVEKAFADAASNLRNKMGFEDALLKRLTPEELSNERKALIDEEVALNPEKCKFKEEQYLAQQCEVTRVGADINQCPAVVEQVVVVNPCNQCQECSKCSVNNTEPCPACVECEKCSPQIVEDSGVIVAHSVTEAPKIVEDSGVIVAHSVTLPTPVVENAGVKSDHIIFKNCIDENGGVVSGGDCVVVDDTWIDMKNGDKTFDSLCIVDRPPYDVLSPENLYKVRASVVEISNTAGKKGAGLIISESFVLTSANIVERDTNVYKMKTINGKELTGRAVRVNLSKNTALIMLDEETKYTPLSLNLDLPKVGQGGFMTLGVLDVEDFEDGENYIDTDGKVSGYRYSENLGSEIMLDTFVQNVTIGGVLIDGNGTINGMAHSGKKTESGMDLFLPTETALRSLGLSICEKLYEKKSPWQQTVYKPATELILKSKPKAPEEMKEKERK